MAYTDLRKGRFSQTGLTYHITTVTKNRLPYFNSLTNGRKIVKQLKWLDDNHYTQTLCYMLMPDHLHWLMVLQKGTLPEVMHFLKGRSAKAAGHALWQANYHDHAIRTDEDIHQLARYIIANPLRAKLVSNIGDYALWDAVWLGDSLSG